MSDEKRDRLRKLQDQMKPKYLHETDRYGMDGKGWYWGWHFLPADGKTQEYDGGPIRRTLVEPGLVLIEDHRDPRCCLRGLHASHRVYDAISYAESCCVSRVILSGRIHLDSDKAAATERTVVGVLTEAHAQPVFDGFVQWLIEQSRSDDRLDPCSKDAVSYYRRWPQRPGPSTARYCINDYRDGIELQADGHGESAEEFVAAANAELERRLLEAMGHTREDELLGWGYADRLPDGSIAYRLCPEPAEEKGAS